MAEPTIDVMMPFYGDAALLRDAVRSVQAQSASDWRLTVVDDCYPDADPGAWVAAQEHPQITYVRNEKRLGVSGNFRRCVELASAPYVTFMGCDDLMGREYVASVSTAIRSSPGVAAVQPRVLVIDDAGRPSGALTDRVKRRLVPRGGVPGSLHGEELATSLLHGNWLYFPAICWSRELLDRHPFRQDMETVLDLDLLLDLTFEGKELLLLPDEAFSYRRHRRSASVLTARDAMRFQEESRLFDEAARHAADLGWARAERAARWHLTSRLHAAVLVPGTLARGDRAAAGRLVRHATRRLKV